MPHEPTVGEVARGLSALHADLKEDLREYSARLDRKVSLERYQLERQAQDSREKALADRVAALEEQRQQEARDRERERRAAEERRRTDRRLLFTALVAPVLLLLLQTYLAARGAAA